jgi:hypothetical protein
MPNPRKPTEMKIASGTFRHDRAKPGRTAAEPCQSATPARSPVGPGAGDMAHNLRHRRRHGGFLTVSDLPALEAVAGALADLRAARASLAKPVVRTDTDAEGNETEREVAAAGERYYWTNGLRRQRPELADIADAERRV